MGGAAVRVGGEVTVGWCVMVGSGEVAQAVMNRNKAAVHIFFTILPPRQYIISHWLKITKMMVRENKVLQYVYKIDIGDNGAFHYN